MMNSKKKKKKKKEKKKKKQRKNEIDVQGLNISMNVLKS